MAGVGEGDAFGIGHVQAERGGVVVRDHMNEILSREELCKRPACPLPRIVVAPEGAKPELCWLHQPIEVRTRVIKKETIQ